MGQKNIHIFGTLLELVIVYERIETTGMDEKGAGRFRCLNGYDAVVGTFVLICINTTVTLVTMRASQIIPRFSKTHSYNV